MKSSEKLKQGNILFNCYKNKLLRLLYKQEVKAAEIFLIIYKK